MLRLLILLIGGLSLGSASAQPRIGIYFDTLARERSQVLEFAEPFRFYVVAQDIPDGLLKWSACVVVPDGIQISESIFYPSNVFDSSGACPDPIFPGCVDATEPRLLMEFRGSFQYALPVDDEEICLYAPQIPAFPGSGSYLNCARQEKELIFDAFEEGGYREGCAVVNATRLGGVAQEDFSFSRVRALYR